MIQETLDRFIELKAEEIRDIHFVEFEGLEFLFRPLKFDEYRVVNELEKFIDGANVNDTLLRMTVYHCTYEDGLEGWLQDGKAGYPDHLAQVVLNISGFQDPELFVQKVEEKRTLATQVQSVLEIYICSAFHSITPREVSNMTLDEQLELFAKAEQAIGKPVDFNEIFGIKDGEEGNAQEPKVPIPPGHETTAVGMDEILDPRMADKPNWNKIAQGRGTD
jgi:hypothetical protein